MNRKPFRSISPIVTGAVVFPARRMKNLGEKMINRITYRSIFIFYLCTIIYLPAILHKVPTGVSIVTLGGHVGHVGRDGGAVDTLVPR